MARSAATGGMGKALPSDRKVRHDSVLRSPESLEEGFTRLRRGKETCSRAGRGALAAETSSLPLSPVWVTEESGENCEASKKYLNRVFIFRAG